jgi:hypothetical protein
MIAEGDCNSFAGGGGGPSGVWAIDGTRQAKAKTKSADMCREGEFIFIETYV